jgi:hypothetical protein
MSWSQRGHKYVTRWRIRVACWITKAACTHMHVNAQAPGHPHASTQAHAHTQTNIKYLLLFLGNKDSRTCLSVMLHVHCLSCLHYLFVIYLTMLSVTHTVRVVMCICVCVHIVSEGRMTVVGEMVTFVVWLVRGVICGTISAFVFRDRMSCTSAKIRTPHFQYNSEALSFR